MTGETPKLYTFVLKSLSGEAIARFQGHHWTNDNASYSFGLVNGEDGSVQQVGAAPLGSVIVQRVR